MRTIAFRESEFKVLTIWPQGIIPITANECGNILGQRSPLIRINLREQNQWQDATTPYTLLYRPSCLDHTIQKVTVKWHTLYRLILICVHCHHHMGFSSIVPPFLLQFWALLLLRSVKLLSLFDLCRHDKTLHHCLDTVNHYIYLLIAYTFQIGNTNIIMVSITGNCYHSYIPLHVNIDEQLKPCVYCI